MINNKLINVTESRRFNGMEGDVFSYIFNKKIKLEAKGLEDTYTKACAEHFVSLPDETVNKLVKYTADYVLALLDYYGDDFYADEDFQFDETVPCGRVLEYLEPVVFSAVSSNFMPVEELTPAFRLTMSFSPIADEEIEWVVRDGEILYVGEAVKASPWDPKSYEDASNFAEE